MPEQHRDFSPRYDRGPKGPMEMLIQYWIHRASLTGFEAHPEFDWIGHGALSAVICLTFGYSAGACAWRRAERDYLGRSAPKHDLIG